MRGRTLGGMAFSPMHANFLVNQGGGTAAQALELMELGRAAVKARFGVELEPEVVVLK
jgi:UDP-N-acetylmuramate dehydrogenase